MMERPEERGERGRDSSIRYLQCRCDRCRCRAPPPCLRLRSSWPPPPAWRGRGARPPPWWAASPPPPPLSSSSSWRGCRTWRPPGNMEIRTSTILRSPTDSFWDGHNIYDGKAIRIKSNEPRTLEVENNNNSKYSRENIEEKSKNISLVMAWWLVGNIFHPVFLLLFSGWFSQVFHYLLSVVVLTVSNDSILIFLFLFK